MLFHSKNLLCLWVLLLGGAAVANAQPQQQPHAPDQPDLAALATPADIAAAGEASPTRGVPGNGARSVDVQGEAVDVEERDVDLEGTSFRTLYRRGPRHVPK